MMEDFRAKVQFTGYLDTRGSEWEGVSERNVRDAIDDMSEEEVKTWMRFNIEAVLESRKKPDT